MSVKEILIQFQDALDDASRRRILERFGLTVKEEILPQRISVVLCPEGKEVSALIGELQGLKEVAHAEPNEEVDLHRGGEPS